VPREGLIVEREVDGVEADGVAGHDHLQLVGAVHAVVVAREGGVDRVVDRYHARRAAAPQRLPWKVGRVQQLVLLQVQIDLHACHMQRAPPRESRVAPIS
jgi:hypothetical protein